MNKQFKKNKPKKRETIITLLIFFFALFCIMSVSTTVYAESVDDKDGFTNYIEELIDCLDFNEIEDFYNTFIDYIQSPSSFKTELKSLIYGSEQREFGDYVSFFFNELIFSIREMVPGLFFITIIAIIEGGFFCIGFNNSNVKEAVFLVCYVASASLLFSETAKIAVESLSFLSNICIALQSAFPFFATVSCICGEGEKIKLFSPICAFVTQTTGFTILKILIPIIIGICALSSVSSLNEKSSIALTRDLLIDAFKWVIGIAVSILSVFTGISGLSCSVRSGISLKTLKYAVGNTVPIIGGFAKESVEIIISAAQVIKSGIGAVFVSILMCVFLKQIVKLICFSLILNFMNAVCMPFVEKRYCDMIFGFKKTISLLIVVYIAVTILFFITCYVLFFVNATV